MEVDALTWGITLIVVAGFFVLISLRTYVPS